MNSRWRLLAVTLLLTATVFTLVHWHRDLEGQRCELCRVQQSPNLFIPAEDPVSELVVQERQPVILELGSESSTLVPANSGRSPPVVFFN
jgi:hypothetical protein